MTSASYCNSSSRSQWISALSLRPAVDCITRGSAKARTVGDSSRISFFSLLEVKQRKNKTSEERLPNVQAPVSALMDGDTVIHVESPPTEQADGMLVDIEDLQTKVDLEKDQAYDWTYENGRRYASTELGHYYMPNDEPEIQRLNEQHWILTQVKHGLLHHAPIKNHAGLKILDVGCGSGIWCLDMAEDYPKALIFGMDVSPIQPQRKPANVEWYTHDLEDEWPFPEAYFDFIHLSLVHGCVSDWQKSMTKMMKHLAPSGWVEHQEFSLCRQYQVDLNDKPLPMSDNPDELPPFFRWNRLMETAGEKRGRLLQLGPRLSTIQREAGLQNVTEHVFNHKWGTWPSDPKEKALGARTMLSAISGMDGFTTIMFTKVLGWTLEDTRAFILEIKRDMRDDSIRKVMDLHVVYGQKNDGKEGTKPEIRTPEAWSNQSFRLGAATGILVGAAAATVISFLIMRKR